MPIPTDITLDPSKFLPANTPAATNALANSLKLGATQWSPIEPLPGGVDIEIPSRDAGRTLPVRVYKPDNGAPSKGLYAYIHGGGWAWCSHRDFDGRIREYANGTQMTVVSIGYRLAPADQYPAAVHDCNDAVEFLTSETGQQRFDGLELRVVGGESAGAHLAILSALHLAKTKPQAAERLAGLVLYYGAYDLSLSLPSMATNEPKSTAVIDLVMMQGCVDGFLGDSLATPEQRRAPEISPLFEDLHGVAAKLPGGKLPPALFLCGTTDPLIDDTVMMSAKWMMTGSDAVVKIYPGAPHGFDMFPKVLKEADESKEVLYQFLAERA